MIKKLNLLNDSALSWGKKINELVDTVNNIVGAQDKIITEKKTAECEPVANIDRCETPTPDSFEESKKWIGCLCKVWDIDEQKCEYAILQEVRQTGCYKYRTNGGVSLWRKCKPVYPNDDIIYKGE